MVNNKWDCLNYGGIWLKQNKSFDDIFVAMNVLFQLAATTEDWTVVMGYSIDSVGLDMQP